MKGFSGSLLMNQCIFGDLWSTLVWVVVLHIIWFPNLLTFSELLIRYNPVIVAEVIQTHSNRL